MVRVLHDVESRLGPFAGLATEEGATVGADALRLVHGVEELLADGDVPGGESTDFGFGEGEA